VAGGAGQLRLAGGESLQKAANGILGALKGSTWQASRSFARLILQRASSSQQVDRVCTRSCQLRLTSRKLSVKPLASMLLLRFF